MTLFHPHPLLWNGHLQTMALNCLPRRLAPFLDGAQRATVAVASDTHVIVEAHWQADPAAAVLLLVHGLSGDARKPYIAGTAWKAWRRGLSVVRMNVRGCGGGERLSPGLYHAGMGDDVHAVLAWLQRTRRPARVTVAGFSLGGAMALHAAAAWGEAPPAPVARLITVSTPFDLPAASRAMHQGGVHRIYVHYFLKNFRRHWRARSQHFPQRYPADGMRGVRTLYEFDERWVAPAFGFGTAARYYELASAQRVLDRVALPVTVIHAEDDPFVPLPAATRATLERLPNYRLQLTRHGGHCAFFAATCAPSDQDRWWAENRVVQWAAA